MTFAARTIESLLVCGDTIYNEYPVNFQIKVYNGAVVVHTETVTGNTLLRWQKEITTINSATKMTLEVSVWSAGLRIVKISEFYTSIIRQYTGNDIMSLGLTEEMELADNSLPIGNISCNEIDIRLNNVDDKFFPGNIDSDLHTLIKPNRKIFAELGFYLPNGDIEYVSLGTYWSGDWDIPEMGTYAGTSARDRMEQLRKNTFSKSDLYHNTNLYDLALVVLEDAKLDIPDLKWKVDEGLADFEVEWAWLANVTYFEALRQIVEACMAQCYCDRDDYVVIGWPNLYNFGSGTYQDGYRSVSGGDWQDRELTYVERGSDGLEDVQDETTPEEITE
jgi:hypothetical protein